MHETKFNEINGKMLIESNSYAYLVCFWSNARVDIMNLPFILHYSYYDDDDHHHHGGWFDVSERKNGMHGKQWMSIFETNKWIEFE